MSNNKKLKRAVKKREVENLVHFTRLSNLDSILKHGIISREQLEQDPICKSTFNDPLRLDRQTNANCCSIDFPNYRMFFPLREDHGKRKWVVLLLDKSILWKNDCAFCVTNAASSTVTRIPIKDRKGKKAFNKLFKEAREKPPRNHMYLPDNFPTDPQAEVLVFDSIKPKHIIQVLTHNQKTAEKLEAKYPSISGTRSGSDYDFFFCYQPFFSPRDDYKFWTANY